MAGGAIRNLLVTVGVEAKNTKDLMDIQDRIDGVGESLGRLQQMALAGVAALGVFGAGVFKLTRGLAAEADVIVNSANMLGLTIESYQGYRAALLGVGLTAEQIDQTFLKMSNTLEKAKLGSKESMASFKALGLTLEQVKNLKPDQMFDVLAERIRKVESASERARLATQIWGDDLARKLLPLLTEGGEQVEVFAKIAQDAGAVMSEEQAKMAARMDKNFRRLAAVVDAMRKRLALQLLPTVDRLIVRVWNWYRANKAVIKQRLDKAAEKISDALEWGAHWGNKFFEQIEKLGGVDKVAGNLIKFFAILTGFKIGFWVKTLGAGVVAFIGGLTVASVKILAVGAAIVGLIMGAFLLIEDFFIWKAGGESLIGSIFGTFGTGKDSPFYVFEIAIMLLEDVIDAVQALGKYFAEVWSKKIAPIISAHLPNIVGGLAIMVVGFIAIAAAATAVIVGGLLLIVYVIADLVNAFFILMDEVGNAWDLFMDFLGEVKKGFEETFEAAEDGVDRALDAFRTFKDVLGGIFSAMMEQARGFIDLIASIPGKIASLPGRLANLPNKIRQDLATPAPTASGIAAQAAYNEMMQGNMSREAQSAAKASTTSNMSNIEVSVEQNISIDGSKDPAAVGDELQRKQTEAQQEIWSQVGANFSTGTL